MVRSQANSGSQVVPTRAPGNNKSSWNRDKEKQKNSKLPLESSSMLGEAEERMPDGHMEVEFPNPLQ